MSVRATHVRKNIAARPRLHVVRHKRARSLIDRSDARRYAPLVIVAAIVAGAVIFGVLMEQIVLAQSAFKLSDLNKKMSAAESQHEQLLYQAARLESPGRIERYARTRLGMIDPPLVNYIVASVHHGSKTTPTTGSQSGDLSATGQAAADGVDLGGTP
jgi:cell division protein FtsB